MDIKENLANNLAYFRKQLNITQAELAQKLNYSDKAVSKWERGESVPDLYVLKGLADFYGVTIDTLISEPKKKPINPIKNINKKRLLFSCCATVLVWIIAVCLHTFSSILLPFIDNTWIIYIYAITINLAVLLVLSSVWRKNIVNMILTSIFLWLLITTIYITLFYALIVVPTNLWQIFLIGIPVQCLILFYFFYKRVK